MLLDEFGPYRPKTRVVIKEDRDAVAAAVARRIMGQHLDLIKTYGVDKVIDAIDDVADYVGDTEEIGTSDVSAWVKDVERTLQSMGPRESAEPGVAEDKKGKGSAAYKEAEDYLVFMSDALTDREWYDESYAYHEWARNLYDLGIGGVMKELKQAAEKTGSEWWKEAYDEFSEKFGKFAEERGIEPGVTEGPVNKKPQPYNDPNWIKKLSKDQIDALSGKRHNKDKKQQGVAEGAFSEIDIDLRSLAGRGDEEDLIAALDGDLGPGTADVLQNMMDELKDELASKGMTDVINDYDKMIELLWDKIVDEYGGAEFIEANDNQPSDNNKPKFTGVPKRPDSYPEIKNTKVLPPAPGRPGFVGKPQEKTNESLRTGEYHVATVTFADGTEKKVKIRSDEGFRDPIIKHFAQQGQTVKDITVDWSVQSEQVREFKDEEDAGDMRTGWLIKKAKRQFPMASSDAEAVAMWMNDKEEKDVDRLDRVNDLEDTMIDRLADFDSKIQQKITDVESRLEKLEKSRSNESRSVTAEDVSKYLAEMKESGYDI